MSRPIPHPSPARRSDRWIPLAFVGFFVVVISVNVFFIFMARQSWNGLVVDNAYEAGQAVARASTKALSIAGEIKVEAATRRVDILVTGQQPADAAPAPLSGHAVLELPSRHAQLLRIELTPRLDDPRTLAGSVVLPIGGPWTITAVLQAGDATRRLSRTLDVE